MFYYSNPDEELSKLEESAKLGDPGSKIKLQAYRKRLGLCQWHGQESESCQECLPSETLEWDEYKLLSTEENIPPDIEDGAAWLQHHWNNLMEDITEMMSHVHSDSGPFRGRAWEWNITGKNIGWRKRSGTAIIAANGGQELLSKILPKTDNTFIIYYWSDRPYFKIVNSHHDAQNEIYYVEPYIENQNFEYDD